MRTADNPRDFDCDIEQHCDECNSRQLGREHYCNDAMGIATPVLWTCYRCANPPVLVGLWRRAKRFTKFHYGQIKYKLTVPKAERIARKERFRAKVAKINERRAARGEKLIQLSS